MCVSRKSNILQAKKSQKYVFLQATKAKKEDFIFQAERAKKKPLIFFHAKRNSKDMHLCFCSLNVFCFFKFNKAEKKMNLIF